MIASADGIVFGDGHKLVMNLIEMFDSHSRGAYNQPPTTLIIIISIHPKSF